MIKEREEAMLIEAGRLTARLIHDFKNQLSGLKLYAAYLKKRFAHEPEGVEIVEKIILGLNEMAENAALANKLMRPAELRLEQGEARTLLRQIVDELQSQAETQSVTLTLDCAQGLPLLSVDQQQWRVAVTAIVRRAIKASAPNSTITLVAQATTGGILVEIQDQAGLLTEEQQQMLLAPLTNERINKPQLELALARHIIEGHGGVVTVLALEPAGTNVQITMPG